MNEAVDKKCRHPANYILYEAAGDVCTLCGVVLQAQTFAEDLPSCIPFHTETANNTEDRLTEAKLQRAAGIFKTFAEALKLPETVVTLARTLHQDLLRAKPKKLRGPLFDASCGSCLYFACAMSGCGRSVAEIVAACGLERKHADAASKLVRRALAHMSYGPDLFRPLDPAHLVPRYLQYLGLPNTHRAAVETLLLEGAPKMPDKPPECVCVAAIAVVSGAQDLDPLVKLCACASKAALESCVAVFQQNKFLAQQKCL